VYRKKFIRGIAGCARAGSSPTLTKAGFEVHMQTGAGIEAGYPDSQYADKGAKLVADRAAVFAADIVVQVFATLQRRDGERGCAVFSP